MFLIAIVILESCSRLIHLQGSGGGDYSLTFRISPNGEHLNIASKCTDWKTYELNLHLF